MNEKNTTVIYHGDCTDGFTAAWVAWLKFGASAKYIPMYHGDFDFKAHEHLFLNKDVYILDYSFSLENYLKIQNTAKSVVLLDHHKSALIKLRGCTGCFFDLNKCGCVIAWNHFFPDEKVPAFLNLVQDMDLEQRKMRDSAAFYQSLLLVEKSFENWTLFLNSTYLNETIEQGYLLLKLHEAQVKELGKLAITVEIAGIPGLAANAPNMFASDLGKLLAADCNSFGMVWHLQATGHVKCSLRSVPDVDCSVLASKFGGGGHPQVSAFYLKNIKELEELVNK